MESPNSCPPEELERIKKQIEYLHHRLENPPKFPTEVYSRITGYYRPLKGWNPGKAEEYRSRRPYTLNGEKLQAPDTRGGQFILVTAPKCPWCEKVKQVIEKTPELENQVKVLSVESPVGESLARAFSLTTVPALVINQSRVISGGPNVLEFLKFLEPLKSSSP